MNLRRLVPLSHYIVRTILLPVSSIMSYKCQKMFSKQLISKEIAEFYSPNLNSNEEDGKLYLNKDYTLQFSKIYASLLSSTIEKSKDLSYDDYLHCYNVLKPVFQASRAGVRSEVHPNTWNLAWLRINIEHFMCCYSSKDTVFTENVETILFLTSTLEYALGSIYFTLSKKSTPPHLLRDLLSTSELLQFFGHEAITFVRILLGIPKSINLRNIVWHGFPKPTDIPSYYVSILLLVIHTLGNMLREKGLEIEYRPQVEDFQPYVTEISRDLPPQLLIKNEDCMELVIEKSSLIAEDYKVYWRRLFQLYRDEKHWKFVILILPQIELILRLKYAALNDFDVSAKLDEYYITMDTIFEPVLPYKSVGPNINRLVSSKSGLAESSLKLLYDLFIAPNGPRLRDKVSHGEVTIESLNNRNLCQILLHLSLHLLEEDDHTRFALDCYESKFHLNSRTKVAFTEAKTVLQKFAQFCSENGIATQSKVNEFESKTGVKIFQRPKKESACMALLFKAANSVAKTCETYVDSISSCQASLAQRELRSRRRRTLMYLLEAVPKIYDCLCSILDCLIGTFEKFQATDSDSDIDGDDQLIKFLKRTLKITENFLKYSSLESNEWIRAVELCDLFREARENLLNAEKQR